VPESPTHSGHLLVTGATVPLVAVVMAGALAAIGVAGGAGLGVLAALHLVWVALLAAQERAQLVGPAPLITGPLPRLAVSGGVLVAVLTPLAQPGSPAWGFAVGSAAVALPGVWLAHYYGALPEDSGLMRPRRLGAHLRLSVWLSVLTGVSLVGHSAPAWAGRALLGAVALEAFFRACVALVRGSEPAPWLLRLGFSSFSPVTSVFDQLDGAFGVDLRHTLALSVARRAVEPLVLVLAAIGWLSTAVTVLEVEQRGVLERFGAVQGDVLQPGLHLHLPWPADQVRRVASTRVRSRTIGYDGSKPGASMLWTRRHARTEHTLLLGDGRDLITINGRVLWRVGDVKRFLYASADPVAVVDSLAYRALLVRTRGRTLEDVLTSDLVGLAADIEAALAQEAKAVGVEVVGFRLEGVHPPVAVAERYQAVVAAQIDSRTAVVEAAAYREERLPQARARAHADQLEAEGKAVHHQAVAAGEAAVFRSLSQAAAKAPGLFRFRRRLEALEEALGGQPLTVVDARFERDGGMLWLKE
jgi:regulator of protease activity HflC (stomatin/prohibitin superfamily)